MKVRGCLATKINIPFFLMGNVVLNIFLCNIFFERSNILEENGEIKILGHMNIFSEKGPSYVKNEYNHSYQKLDAKYFYVI